MVTDSQEQFNLFENVSGPALVGLVGVFGVIYQDKGLQLWPVPADKIGGNLDIWRCLLSGWHTRHPSQLILTPAKFSSLTEIFFYEINNFLAPPSPPRNSKLEDHVPLVSKHWISRPESSQPSVLYINNQCKSCGSVMPSTHPRYPLTIWVKLIL